MITRDQYRTLTLFFVLFFILTGISMNGQKKLYDPPVQVWKPIQDKVYLQDSGIRIKTDKSVEAVASFKGNSFAVMDGKLYTIEGNKLHPAKDALPGINRLMEEGGKLWALTGNGLYLFKDEKWKRFDDRDYVDMCMHMGVLHAATMEDIYKLSDGKFVNIKPEGGYNTSDITMIMEDGSQVHADPVRLGPIKRIESYSNTLYVLRPGQLVLLDNTFVNTDFIDWGIWPSKDMRDMLSYGSKLFVSTERGLGMLRGASLFILKGEDGLPYENTTVLKKGFDNDIWIGTTKGAIRMLDGEWQYFAADHWLPGNNVHDIAVGKDEVIVATDAGIGIIKYEPFTLRKKVDYYEQMINDWGFKRMGFIHILYKKDGKWIREISDNDGGHTAPYLAAMSFKYAVTGDEEARREAVDAFKAMLWLERITPIDGYVARAIYSPDGDEDKMSLHGSGGLPAKWHKTKDGKWYWKGDTSSDEIIAHFFSVTIFYELAAEGKDKEMAREHIQRIASYIMDNGWMLIGMDGKPTRWGRWNPEYLLRPYGYQDRGVNGLEALAFMRAAYSVTGDKKYEEGYQQLVKWGYRHNTIRQKNTFPPADIAPWDDDLAYQAYYTLMRYIKDPVDLSAYMRSIARTWEVKRIEHYPLFNFGYGAISGNDCEQDQSAKFLRDYQLDCILYNYRNSYRDDLYIPKGYRSYETGTRPLSPRETQVSRSSRTFMTYDGGSNGNVVREPTDFILFYWMGRYHGMIGAPETTDVKLTSVKPLKKGEHFGAEPYNGPKRPKLY